ncbi:hypothetical protein V2W30_41250 (plasmid) [Streptomyces sp. Q6]|uniref:Uncharacterized protein n=1 Tax=Streptomyces citrinus TaxID=3118173 RepID=A0ACD5AQY0_9ACTN
MFGPDLPPASEPMTFEAFLARWPTGAWKTEMIDGVVYFYGEFDERDVQVAERAYPGRRALINRANDLELHPGGTARLRSVLEVDSAASTDNSAGGPDV